MWVVAVAMMALMFFGGGHLFHKHDDGHGKKQPAVTSETQTANGHGAVTDTIVGRDKGNDRPAVSGAQVPGREADGTPEACDGDACSAPDGKNSFFP